MRIILHCNWKNCIYSLIIQLLKRKILKSVYLIKSDENIHLYHTVERQEKQKLINIHSNNNSIFITETIHNRGTHNTKTTYRNRNLFRRSFVYTRISNSYNPRKRNCTSIYKWMPCTRITLNMFRKFIHFSALI